MSDIVDSETRSRMMSRIRGKNTGIEVRIRKALWMKGLRYRLPKGRGYLGLPGIPDMVFPKYHAIILVNGCFFHGHDCYLFVMPQQNRQFWEEKISSNRRRDLSFSKIRKEQGWKTLTIWECAVRGRDRKPFAEVIREASDWVKFGTEDREIAGGTPKK